MEDRSPYLKGDARSRALGLSRPVTVDWAVVGNIKAERIIAEAVTSAVTTLAERDGLVFAHVNVRSSAPDCYSNYWEYAILKEPLQESEHSRVLDNDSRLITHTSSLEELYTWTRAHLEPMVHCLEYWGEQFVDLAGWGYPAIEAFSLNGADWLWLTPEQIEWVNSLEGGGSPLLRKARQGKKADLHCEDLLDRLFQEHGTYS